MIENAPDLTPRAVIITACDPADVSVQDVVLARRDFTFPDETNQPTLLVSFADEPIVPSRSMMPEFAVAEGLVIVISGAFHSNWGEPAA